MWSYPFRRGTEPVDSGASSVASAALNGASTVVTSSTHTTSVPVVASNHQTSVITSTADGGKVSAITAAAVSASLVTATAMPSGGDKMNYGSKGKESLFSYDKLLQGSYPKPDPDQTIVVNASTMEGNSRGGADGNPGDTGDDGFPPPKRPRSRSV